MVGIGFVLAAIAETVVRHHDDPGLLVLGVSGAPWLVSLALRRSHPVVPVAVIAAASVLGTVLTPLLRPGADGDAGVWIIALMLAAYSLGAHAAGPVVTLGVVLPCVVVVVADATTRTGWDRVNGMLFVTAFVGLLPTAVGRMVRVRHERLLTLRTQRERILRAQQADQQAAVLAERLQTLERLQPTLLSGLQELASSAGSRPDPAAIETSARALLTRTREEVVALTAPDEEPEVAELPRVDHLQALRQAAQPWTVVAAGGLAAGLALEWATLDVVGPTWAVVPAALVAGIPVAFAWWRPALATALAWGAVTAYSRLVAPLDGSLSETAFALGAAFAVALLSRRREAVAGLVICLLGQVVGVDTADPWGDSLVLLVCWLGGVAVNEVNRLVEQTRANTELLGRHQAVAAARAVVEERLRMAREIHDAIGHSLTVIALQAGAARRMAATDPARAAEVMQTVAAVAGSGVVSLLDPSPTDVAALVDRVRSTGLVVDAELGDAALLDPAQRLVAVRVLQEGLTNVLRHAPGARASVTVRRAGDGFEVAVVNSAPTGTGPEPGTGRGLAGIRERVSADAGRATWGPTRDGGFEVRAWLPVSSVSVTAS